MLIKVGKALSADRMRPFAPQEYNARTQDSADLKCGLTPKNLVNEIQLRVIISAAVDWNLGIPFLLFAWRAVKVQAFGGFCLQP